MTTKRPLPMLFAGIAMILYPVIEILTIILSTISNLQYYTHYIELLKAGYIDIRQIFMIFGEMIGGNISDVIWLLLLAIVGIIFIIAFIKPCKVLYIASFVLLGLIGFVLGLIVSIGNVVEAFIVPFDQIEEIMSGNTLALASYMSYFARIQVIHSLAAVLLAVFALLSFIPKAGKVISKFWILPTILSGVEFVISFVMLVVVRLLYEVPVASVIGASLFNLPIIGFTVCILLAGLGMSSMVKKNFGKVTE